MAGLGRWRIGFLLLICTLYQLILLTSTIKCYMNLCHPVFDDSAKATGEFKCNGAKDNDGIGRTMPCAKGSYCSEATQEGGALRFRKCDRDNTSADIIRNLGKMPYCEPLDSGEICFCREDLCNTKVTQLPPLQARK